MKLGDLVTYQKARWLIIKYDPQVQAGTGLRDNRTQMEIPDDAKGLKIECNPAEDWNLLSLPTRDGYIQNVFIPRIGRENISLKPWEEWLQSDPTRKGGSILIHPDVKLSFGDRLTYSIVNGQKMSHFAATIPRFWGTSAQRQKAAVMVSMNPASQLGAAPAPVTRFTNMLDDEDK